MSGTNSRGGLRLIGEIDPGEQAYLATVSIKQAGRSVGCAVNEGESCALFGR